MQSSSAEMTMQSSSAEVTMMESQNRKRAPAWTEWEGMKDRGHNRDLFDSFNGDGGNMEAGFGDEEGDDDEVLDSSQQANGETGFPNSQELFLTQDLEPVPTEPTQGGLPDPPGVEGTSSLIPCPPNPSIPAQSIILHLKPLIPSPTPETTPPAGALTPSCTPTLCASPVKTCDMLKDGPLTKTPHQNSPELQRHEDPDLNSAA
ncbi:hypothetical protein UY3_12958 [Chelonia mydas]|uniref:Uncharacterized protein n=1 Tax=Chelonia mydas TaxID=8469 RepID=M7AWV2_CHEMY|nr:hypothetical protein UY3_12958 [Chelonia mydas]